MPTEEIMIIIIIIRRVFMRRKPKKWDGIQNNRKEEIHPGQTAYLERPSQTTL